MTTTVTGYAWSQNYGWINLAPDNGGITNNAGALSGHAWGQNTGWIDFSGATINSLGQFTVTASGNIVGTINFSCTDTGCPVTTNWRLASGGPMPAQASASKTTPLPPSITVNSLYLDPK